MKEKRKISKKKIIVKPPQNKFYSYISDTKARNLHMYSPNCHGYCSQNMLNSLGKPVKQRREIQPRRVN